MTEKKAIVLAKEILLGEITTNVQESPLATRGIRVNRKKPFSITLSGKEWYSLLTLLEDDAVSHSNYLEVRALVLWVEKIRLQLEAQGF